MGNDYLYFNGNKYYLQGGNIKYNGDDDPYIYPSENHKFAHSGFGWKKYGGKEIPFVNSKPKSKTSGHAYYQNLNEKQKEDFVTGRKLISDFLKEQDINGEYKDLLEQFDSDTDNYKNYKTKGLGTNVGYDNETSRKVYYLMNNYGNGFENDNYEQDGGISLGANITERIGTFNRNNSRPFYKNEFDVINNILSNNNKYKNFKYDNSDVNRYVDDEGYKYYSIRTGNRPKDGGKVATGNLIFVLDKNNKPVSLIGNNRSSQSNSNLKYNTNIRIAKKGETGLPFIENYRKGDADTDYYEFNNTNIPWYNHSRNLDDWTNYNTQENPINWNACGGRKYAYGGETEDVGMPLNMPQGYNAINEGGIHEQNPNGGVPYGMNSDGSQNLVEEGEASVDNNIFSDRIPISQELSQQLGLPNGTTYADAIQQIEQLYEQGQIGDEEFNEIQQILFQDQENQKQNFSQQQQQQQDVGIPLQQQYADGGWRGFRIKRK